jgi:hypothetical protein
MKNLILFCFLLMTIVSFGQNSSLVDKNYQELFSDIGKKIDSLKQNPDNWDKVMDILEKEIEKKDTVIAKWINDLNIDFKTFQSADSSQSSLGFSYNLNIERANIKRKGDIVSGKSISFESKGNIAFKKEVNPTDFLNSKISLNLFHSGGGKNYRDTTVADTTLARLKKQIATKYKSDREIVKSEEWKEYNKAFPITNDWIIKYDINAGIESNQDFSKVQNTFGARFGAGVKAWDDNNIIAKLNVIDYPFALIRRITGYDYELKSSGATVPSMLVGFDYVIPTNDTIRKNIEGELKPYPRFNLEVGYRTVITEVASQTIFFNCSYRYFVELGASQAIKDNSLDMFSYFTSSLSASNGFYISYSLGKLPFDRQNDAIYELGFKYKFH